MCWKRGKILITAAAAAVAAITAATVALTSPGRPAAPGRPGHRAAAAGVAVTGAAAETAAPGGFGWFRARPRPPGWRQAALPGGGAVLSFPASLAAMPGDAGTVTRGRARAGAVLVYLNVTPRQGGETLSGWARFRVGHLTEDDARSARLDAAAAGLAFRGGTGSCVIDDYTTRVRANHYREIACYVRGAHASSVLVAATPAADWARYAGLLERAVDSYAVS